MLSMDRSDELQNLCSNPLNTYQKNGMIGFTFGGGLMHSPLRQLKGNESILML